MEYKKLVMVTTGANHNKYYEMIPNADGSTFTVKYGRVGANPQVRAYGSYDFNKKYREKLNKGYVDQTHLVMEKVNKIQKKYKDISDKGVFDIVNRLQEMANKAISSNYTVSADEVTQRMVDSAKEQLNRLANVSSVNDFNEILLGLFTIIPRKMGKVANYLANDVKDFEKLVQNEQDLLDVMAAQVKQIAKTSDEDEGVEQTLLEDLGISVKPATDKEKEKIKKMIGRMGSKFKDAWVVDNKETRKAFNKHKKELGKPEVKQLFHGSRNENWWSIVNNGLSLNPNAVITGKMFGQGIYFANVAAKACGYTSNRGSRWANGSDSTGFLAVYDVIYGTPYMVDQRGKKGYADSYITYDKLQKMQAGADCLHATKDCGLLNDEIIVYKETQSTVKYLVELYN